MPVDRELNVFSGEEALRKFYDPDAQAPVPLVELPAKLNPLRKDGVRIYAKLLSHLPATNVKSLPALNLLLRGMEKGKITEDTHTIVEYSSGSTVISLGILANIMGIPHVKAYLSNKTSQTKLDLLRFFGLDLTVFGGHGQPEPNDPNGGIYVATQHGQQEGYYNPDQYSNPENYEAHIRWTGPQIYNQLPEIKVFAASIGTSGTMTGTGLYLKEAKPSCLRVGVCTAPDDRVPGPRSYSLLAPVEFPWRESVNAVEEIASPESFEKSLELCRNGLLVGPSSGLALLGLLKHLNKLKEKGELDQLRNEDTGEIPCVFICCDQPFQYISEYYTKLGPEHFTPITNELLLGVDPYPYNVDWEFPPRVVRDLLQGKPVVLPPTLSTSSSGKENTLQIDPSRMVVLDLRATSDFAASRLPGSVNLDVGAREQPNPYQDPPTMVRQFRVLDERLAATDSQFGAALDGKVVFTLSYKGHVARLAMSILRNRKVQAHCVMGGSDAWIEQGLWEGSCA
ncbi:cysteine synthase [Phanerochaete sordida]|uniref:Cysteine synthase n=1 Tax=Phanerochaete sordida TaxID=48140 RepID=A0A9P3GCY8_9APHY|nr:cysteine synthase [Phanerochaete sordida]